MLRLSDKKVVILFRLQLILGWGGGAMCDDSVVKTSTETNKLFQEKKPELSDIY